MPEIYFHNDEEMSLKEGGEFIEKIGESIRKSGRVVLEAPSGEEVVNAQPPERVEVRLRYERLPRGEMALKVELVWWPPTQTHRHGTKVKVRPPQP